MQEEVIIRHCSPTLAGIKTGNIFTYSYDCENTMRDELRSLNKRLVPKGLCAVPLRYTYGKALIYVFRPSSLECDLSCPKACKLLKNLGYSCGSCPKYITQLINRLKESQEFPHEIGLFLGYPLEDVLGFINNKGRNCKYIGCWKVYSDEEICKKIFTKYKSCKETYLKKLSEGMTIDQLIVAV